MEPSTSRNPISQSRPNSKTRLLKAVARGARVLLVLAIHIAWVASASAQSPPQLLVEPSAGSQVRLSWEATAGPIVLEETETLSLWRPVPQIPALANGRFSVLTNIIGGTRFFRLHWIVPGGLPPDPSSVAPPLPGGVASVMGRATEFLYTGSIPIQTGVVAGTIEATRAAVIRGLVKTRDTTPLSGVTISILNRPEFGETLTRVDGMFDMAVNGGGLLTINYQKAGYLPAQRQVTAHWQDFAFAADVILIPVDPQVTTITVNAGVMQVARGSMMADSDGSRQATLLVPAGTTAAMVMPDGSTQTLSALNVRATEYTIGPNGLNAMPAALPPTSGYTYAVELSADEALSASARRVTFSQPLFNYVENFLAFPVGMIVPNGYYERNLAAWVASENGRVVKITGVTAGSALVDTVGTGGLPPLTLSAEERQQLALLYSVGQELWRVPIAHFTPWDHNWPYGPPDDAVKPEQPPETDEPLDDPCLQTGSSIIESENQVLGETIGIVGTDLSLHYQSNRVRGRKTAYTLDIPLSGAQLPSSLRRIELEVFVAGRRFAQVFGTAPNQRQSFVWDGRDAYGRVVSGVAEATVRVGYVYPGVYQQPGQFARSFGAFSGIPITGNRSRAEITLWKESRRPLGTLPGPVGGWSFSPHHAYDSIAKVLYLGDGRRLSARAIDTVINTVAGNGTVGPNLGDGGAATHAGFTPAEVAIAPDGTVFIAELNYRIRRVGMDGIITTVAGTGTMGFSGDGGPATQAQLTGPNSIAMAPDGGFYFIDRHRIRRVGADGIITTVAGTGTAGFSGDGGPAIQAQFAAPDGLERASDGSLYVADIQNYRIRRIGPDGIITTVVGTGTMGFSGDGGPATQARLGGPFDVAVGPDGSMYLTDLANSRIRRVGPEGIINTVAGSVAGFSGDGGPGTLARLNNPVSVDVGHDGSVYIAELNNSRIRRLGPDGIINSIAGNGTGGFSGDGGPGTQARLSNPIDVAVGPDGSLYVADLGNRRIRRLAPALPGFPITDLRISAADGSEIYIFNREGRHLRTFNALTGGLRYDFAYDSAGRLASVTDGDGNPTTIQRDGSGNPTMIVGPLGQSTALSTSSDGYLSQITSPAGEKVQLGYTADGLLTSLSNPRGHASNYTFDTLGRLTSATDPTGAVKTLARTGKNMDSMVTTTTALGRKITYRGERLSNGDTRRTITDAGGQRTEVVKSPNGTQTATYPDGTTVRAVLGPDPRWGMQAPVFTSVVVTTPDGKAHTTTTQRTVTLSSPTNPLSLTTLNETVAINGRAITRAFTASSRTFTTTSPTGRRKTTVVDLLGRPVQAQFGGLAATSFTYDPKGRLADRTQGSGASLRTLTLGYGVNGFLQTATDPVGRVLTFARDLNGRIINLIFPDGGETHFAYDANGNLASVTPPDRPEHRLTYTQTNQLSRYEAPVVGAESNQTQYTYNADRQPLQVERPDGQSATFQYNNAGAQHRVDMAVGDILDDYDLAGRLASGNRDQGAALTYAWDGTLLTRMTWSGAITGSVTWTYDNNFRMISLSVNDNNPVAVSYDLDGLAIQVGSLTLTRSAQSGLVTGNALGTVTEIMTYDIFGALATQTASQGSSAIYSATHTRDALGRLVARNETIEGVARAFSYSYDLTGRLEEVRLNGVVNAGYTYDGNGNRLSLTDSSGTSNATYDAQDRLEQLGATTYLHNANGERLSKTAAGQTTHYQYDTLGNLIGVTLPNATQVDFVLDRGQRRVGRRVNGTLVQGFIYQDGLKPIAELNGANAVVSRFVYSTGVNVPAYLIKAGTTYRMITDHLGSPRLVVDSATGTIVQRLDYDEFGKVTLDTNPGFQPFGFAGGLYDHQTGLVHYGAREYDPETGRWTAKDPIGFRGGQANLYAYVSADPINRADPTGLVFGDLLDAVLKPLPDTIWGAPCAPGDTTGEGNVRDALGNLIDNQVDNGVQKITGGAKFLEPVGTAIDAATVSAQGIIIVHEAPREQRDLIDSILTGSTDEQDYATRRYYVPNGPKPCPPTAGGSPCGR